MLTHTMIVSFNDQIADAELDRFLAEMEELVAASGLTQRFASRHHVRIPADDHAPAFVASAIVQIDVADVAALNASFAVDGLEELIDRWQSRHPYRVVWANHEPLT